MRNFFFLAYIVFYLFFGISLCGLANETNHWSPTVAVVTQNNVNERTMTYEVNKKLYTTSNENIVDIFAKRLGGRSSLHPGHSRTVINGVDQDIGKQETVYYNPSHPSDAVVNKGWSDAVVLYLICTAIPILIRFFVAMASGTSVSSSD